MTLPDFEGVARFSTVVVFDVSLQFCLLAALGTALCVFLRKSDPRLRHLLWLLVLARLAVPFDLQSPAGLSPAIESGLLSGALTGLALFSNPEKPVNLGRSAVEVLPARPTSGEGWATRAPRAKLAQPSTYSGAIEGTGNTISHKQGAAGRSPVLVLARLGHRSRSEKGDPDPGDSRERAVRTGCLRKLATHDSGTGPDRQVLAPR